MEPETTWMQRRLMTDAEAARAIAENVRYLLKKRGLSQAWLARQTKDKPATIHRLLTGKHVPRIGVVERVSNVLDNTPDWCLYFRRD